MTASPSSLAGTASLHAIAGRLAPACGGAALVLVMLGLAIALAVAPVDPVQGHARRIAAVHYPAQLLAFGVYVAMGALSLATTWRGWRPAAVLASGLAPTGVLFTLLALWTDALWRRPLRGTWWVWDAETVAELLLLFLYGGFIALKSMVDDPRRADRAGALLAVLGLGNLPVLYFSLRWWDDLRGTALAAPREPAFEPALVVATVLVGAGFAAYAAFAALKRARCLIDEREALARSVRLMESAA